VRHAPLDVLSEPASIEVHAWEHCDAWLGVQAPENTRDGADIPTERTNAVNEAYDPARSRLGSGDRVRPSRDSIPWVLCWYPTPALAQDAGMTLPAFADFLYDACLIDWKGLHERISRHREVLMGIDDGRHDGFTGQIHTSRARGSLDLSFSPHRSEPSILDEECRICDRRTAVSYDEPRAFENRYGCWPLRLNHDGREEPGH